MERTAILELSNNSQSLIAENRLSISLFLPPQQSQQSFVKCILVRYRVALNGPSSGLFKDYRVKHTHQETLYDSF